MFADASTGSRSPALVHQGRIGEIIQAKPEQRRRVLEEAAGISGLHARRHEAELRLKAAETNLVRVEDVVQQLAGQIDALKRQARQAIRYRNVSAEVRKVEATLYCLRWLGAKTEVADSERAKDLSVRAVAEATLAQSDVGKGREGAAAAVPPLRENEARAAAALQRLLIARDTLDAEETRARERMAELERRLAQFAEDVARERTLVADAEAALEQLGRKARRSSATPRRARSADQASMRARPQPRAWSQRSKRPSASSPASSPTSPRGAINWRRPRASNPSASPGSKARSPISRRAWPRPARAVPISLRLPRPWPARRPPSPRPSRRRSPPKPPTTMPGATSMPRACRSPTPSARRSASIPKPRR